MGSKTSSKTVEKEICLPPNGKRPQVTYRLCRQTADTVNGHPGKENAFCFSLCCETADECAVAHDLTTERAKAERWFAILIAGEVTPAVFYEILEELFAQEAYEAFR